MKVVQRAVNSKVEFQLLPPEPIFLRRRMRKDRKEYMREYQYRWIASRRMKWISKNGPCSFCGSFQDLEVDHIDPDNKEFNPKEIWSRSEKVRDEELKKCQVLCRLCHLSKTAVDLSRMNTGVPNFKLRTVSDEQYLAVKALVDKGLSERKACLSVGISRGTYSSAKSLGVRVFTKEKPPCL
jgi:5-methylcytosine-specific restriction endonuclease McrA